MQRNKNPRKRPKVVSNDVIDVDAITIDVDAMPGPAEMHRTDEVLEISSERRPKVPQEEHIDIDLTTAPRAEPPPRRVRSIFDTPAPAPSQPPTRKPRPPSSSSSHRSRGDLEEDEVTNPSVSVVDLFRRYNHQYFWGSLNGVYVEFSTRMTSCAGTCTFKGKHGGCRIALSEPLLKFRPRSDLLSTLLHEMIHAYLFLKDGIARDGFDGHGPKFLSHASRINMQEKSHGVLITPYHTFHDEVELYRVHHWTCAKCGKLVKRAMNRAPSKWDTWWAQHVSRCGGEFIKTKEPPPKPKKVSKRKLKAENKQNPPGKRVEDLLFKKKKEEGDVVKKEELFKEEKPKVLSLFDSKPKAELLFSKEKKADCPVCGKAFEERLMNDHLDHCLSIVDEPQQEAPLSGRLFKERHHQGGSSRAGTGESGHVNRSAANIDLVSIAMQKMFGGTDSIVDSSLLPQGVDPRATNNTNRKSGLILELASAGDKSVIQPPFIEPSTSDVVNDLKRRLGVIELPAHPNRLPVTPIRLQPHSKPNPYTTPQVTGNGEAINLDVSPSKSPFTLAAQENSSPGQRNTPRRHEWWKPKPSNTSPLKRKGHQELTGRSPKKGPAAGKIKKHHKPNATYKSPTTNCPMCNKPFPRVALNSHVTECLGDLDLGQEFEEAQPPPRVDGPSPEQFQNNRAVEYQSPSKPIHAPSNLNRNQAGPLEMMPCPVCNTQILRDNLQSHTSECLQNCGIDFS